MGFDDRFVEQVRNSATIVDVIGRYVHLKKRGKDHGALCPFHNEKTPSFWVSEQKQIFKCFGCGAGGDTFAFIMRMESLAFPDAVRHLAEQYGVPLPDLSPAAEKKRERNDKLRALMELASKFFRESFEGADGARAREYLRDRGIDKKTVEGFGLGFAPPGNRLLARILDRGYSKQEALDCGLAKTNDSGEVYSNFRNRVIFPIRDISGKAIAFGGRILGDGRPKYLNSPETALYVKSRNLFGLDVARKGIRNSDFVILVEGYFDCLIPFQHGVQNIVASLGTSLTSEQVAILGRYTRNIVVNYDPDAAGIKAALRSIDLLLEQGFSVKVLQLPEGKDPDEFIIEHGVQAYREHLEDGTDFIDFALARLMDEQRDPFSPRGRKEIVGGILPYLAKVTDRIERAGYVARIAGRLRLDERVLLAEIRKTARPAASVAVQSSPGRDGVTHSEKVLLAALLDPEHCREAIDGLEPELFLGLATEETFSIMFRLCEGGAVPTAVQLRAEVSEEGVIDLIERLAVGVEVTQLSKDAIQGSKEALKQFQIRRQRSAVQAQLKLESDPQKQMQLMSRIQALAREEMEGRRPVAPTGAGLN